jgi:hypothetical protein
MRARFSWSARVPRAGPCVLAGSRLPTSAAPPPAIQGSSHLPQRSSAGRRTRHARSPQSRDRRVRSRKERSFLLGLAILITPILAAQEPTPPPVPFPDITHYAPLWEKSLFTTRDLPSPDAPAGPIFTDSLSLTGIYELDGKTVAVLVDKATSLISEARFEEENEAGIKIRKVTPGASMDKTRVQLQKGDQAGWVSFGDIRAPAAPPPSPALETRQPASAGGAPVGGVTSPLLPPPSVPQAPPGDVPLPPP